MDTYSHTNTTKMANFRLFSSVHAALAAINSGQLPLIFIRCAEFRGTIWIRSDFLLGSGQDHPTPKEIFGAPIRGSLVNNHTEIGSSAPNSKELIKSA